MGKKIRLNESELYSIIESSVKDIINEENYRKGVQFINEGYELPHKIVQIWANGDDAFVVKGSDGVYYDVYPQHHDSYKLNSDADDIIDAIGDKVQRAFNNHGIAAMCLNYNGVLIIEIRSANYNGEYDDRLKAWLESKGFTFVKYDEMYKAYHYAFNNHSTTINQEKLKQHLEGYVDITDKAMPYLSGDSIEDANTLPMIYRYFFRK